MRSDDWETPQWLFEKLNEEYPMHLDLAANAENSKCQFFISERTNALSTQFNWNEIMCPTCWLNPPYKRDIQTAFIKKASKTVDTRIVALLPARTDTKAFHDYIYRRPNTEIRFLKGRLKFSNSKQSAPFPSMLVIFNIEIPLYKELIYKQGAFPTIRADMK